VAEFCKQCAAALDLLASDFNVDQEGIVQTVLCEGCGPTNVDGHGTCIYDCERRHAPVRFAGNPFDELGPLDLDEDAVTAPKGK
jgi:hypothetical protein